MAGNNLSFKDMYDNVLAFMQTSSSDTTSLALVKSEINRVYERIATEYDWDELWDHKGLDDTYTVTSGTPYLALPSDCQHVKEIYNKSKNLSYLPQSMRHLVRDNIDTLATNGAIDSFFTIQGRSATTKPLPENGDVIEVRSDNAADTSQTVRIVALRVPGATPPKENRVEDSVGLNGLTWVAAADTFQQGWSIDSISCDATRVGSVEVREQTSQVIISAIPPEEKQAQYTIVRFENPPDAADEIIIYYKKRVNFLSNDNDAVIIPDIAQVIIEEVKGSMRQFNKKYQQGGVHLSQASRSLGAVLKDRKMNAPVNRQARPNFCGRDIRRAY